MDASFLGLAQHHASQMDYALKKLVDTILKHSALSISLLRISSVSEESFHVSLEARVVKTGPTSATISPMTLDLCGPLGCFGKIKLPAITTQTNGTDVVVNNQLVEISDTKALQAFIEPLLKNEGVKLSLRNGNATIKALGVGPREICYEKDIDLKGMNGPIVRIRSADLVQSAGSRLSVMSAAPSVTSEAPALALGPRVSTTSTISGGANNVSIVFSVDNPSPLELSFGLCVFEIQDNHGMMLVELKGRLDIRCHHFQITLQGPIDKIAVMRLAASMQERKSSLNELVGGKDPEELGHGPPEARLVGKRCGGAGWCDDTVKGINVSLHNVGRLFRALGLDADVKNAEEEPKEDFEQHEETGISKWKGKFGLR
ncbi:hypothetical protein GGR57DRAFT_354344 [Xylariaceae sp. FL1272]|nr:hypothetical protein GGR57DRAFT_354344 [Xylariaceae sp. FL1272]